MSAEVGAVHHPLVSAFRRAPLMRAALPFMAGIVLAAVSGPSLRVAWGMAVLCFVLFVFLSMRRTIYERRWERGAVLLGLMVSFGCLWGVVRDPRRSPATAFLDDARCQGMKLRVLEVTGTSSRTVKAFAEVDAVDLDGEWVRGAGVVVVTLFDKEQAPLLQAGERLVVARSPVRLLRAADPGGFDPVAWAASHGARHEVFAGQGQWRVSGSPGPLDRAVAGLRGSVVQWIGESGLDASERGLVKALLLGIRDELDAEQKVAFARSGTIHVLAVSGMHVGLVYAVFMALLVWWGRKPHAQVLRGLLILVFLWGYAGLTGWSPSVLRATVMFSFFTVGEMIERRTEPLNSLFGAAFVLLLWDPVMLFQLSFQLSFLAVLGILLFYKPIQRLWHPPGRVLHYFWSLAAVSIAAQVITTPLSLYLFKAFPVWFLPANLVIVGLVSICVYAGALMVLLHKVPVLGDALRWLNERLVEVLDLSARFFADLPGAYPAVRVDGIQMVLLYLLLLMTAAWMLWKWRPLRFAVPVVLLALFGTWGWGEHERDRQHGVSIYAERDRLSLAVVEGRNMTVFADSQDTYLERKVDLHARSVGASIVSWSPIPRDRALVISGSAVPLLVMAPGRAPDLAPPRPTAVVLRGDGRFDLEALSALDRGMWPVILAPDIPARRRAYLRKWCVENGIACHDVDRQGAIILEP